MVMVHILCWPAGCLPCNKSQDKAMTMPTTKAFTITLDLLICSMTVCAERRLQGFHITPQASIGLVKNQKMFCTVSPPVQSSGCRRPHSSVVCVVSHEPSKVNLDNWHVFKPHYYPV